AVKPGTHFVFYRRDGLALWAGRRHPGFARGCPNQNCHRRILSPATRGRLRTARTRCRSNCPHRIGSRYSPFMNRIAAFLIGAALATSALAQKISLVGGTVVNPADGKIVQNAVLVINGDKIESVASRKESGVPVGSRWVECDGKFILPGYIDTHVHFFQSGDLFTRPDGADLNSVRPYKEEVGWIKSHLADTFARYLRCGITSVVDVGGPIWNFEVRKTADSTAKAARAAVEEGADVLVHSVIDKPVDDTFVKLLKDRHTILCPTLVVFERYGRTFANKLNLTPEEKAWGNPEVIASLDVTKIPSDKLPERIKTALSKPDEALDRIKKTYDVAFKNLKTLEDAGVTIAAGTDAGNIGTIHGPALFREFQVMKEAGLKPMQILQSATLNAAQLFGGETGAHIGRIEKGYFADLVVLNSNPADDIAHASDIESVIKNGVLYSANNLL